MKTEKQYRPGSRVSRSDKRIRFDVYAEPELARAFVTYCQVNALSQSEGFQKAIQALTQ